MGAVSSRQHGAFYPTQDVLINEVMPHPGQDYNHDGSVSVFGDEYIELINVGTRAIHLGGWNLDDIPGAGSGVFRIHDGTIIEPGKVLVMFRSVSGLALNDDYDLVQLRYPDGELADEVGWEKDPGVDYSISRNGAGPGAFSYDWLPTPGMSNQARPGAGLPPLAPLGQARTWDDGAYLTIDGWVTGPYPLFGERAIYVQDASGAGVVLYLGDGDFPAMGVGQRVRAYGYLRTVTGERELYVKSLYQLSLGESGPGPPPQRIATGAVGEATEGRLVQISGRVTRLEADSAWLDDGSGPARVFFAASTGLERPAMARGQAWEIVGIVSEFTTGQSLAPNYRVLVRFASDLLVWVEDEVPAEAQAQSAVTAARPSLNRALWSVPRRLGWWRPR